MRDVPSSRIRLPTKRRTSHAENSCTSETGATWQMHHERRVAFSPSSFLPLHTSRCRWQKPEGFSSNSPGVASPTSYPGAGMILILRISEGVLPHPLRRDLRQQPSAFHRRQLRLQSAQRLLLLVTGIKITTQQSKRITFRFDLAARSHSHSPQRRDRGAPTLHAVQK
jgi:hypothetical protein